MSRAKDAAEKMGLTLEMLFRAADSKCKGVVKLEEFKLFLQRIKLKLASAQLARFLYLVDEECTGHLERDDFYTTLAAYGINSEIPDSRNKGRTFEQEYFITKH